MADPFADIKGISVDRPVGQSDAPDPFSDIKGIDIALPTEVPDLSAIRALQPGSIETPGEAPDPIIEATVGAFDILETFAPADSGTRLGLSLTAAGVRSEQRAQKNIINARKLGFPLDLVESAPDEFDQLAEASRGDRAKYVRTSPLIAEWMAIHPNHAAAMKLSANRMSAFERAVSLWADGLNLFTGTGHAGFFPEFMTDPVSDMIGRMRGKVAGQPVFEFAAEDPFLKQSRWVGSLQMELSGLAGKLFDKGSAGLTKQENDRLARLQQTLQEHGEFKVDGSLIVGETIKMIPQVIASQAESLKYATLFGGLGWATGVGALPAAGGGYLAGQYTAGAMMSRNLLYADLLQQGYDARKAQALATAGGVINGALEMVAGKAMGRVIPGVRTLLKKTGSSANKSLERFGQVVAQRIGKSPGIKQGIKEAMDVNEATAGRLVRAAEAELGKEIAERAFSPSRGVIRVIGEQGKKIVGLAVVEGGTEMGQQVVEESAKIIAEMDQEGWFTPEMIAGNADSIWAEFGTRGVTKLPAVWEAGKAGAAAAVGLGLAGVASTMAVDVQGAIIRARQAKYLADRLMAEIQLVKSMKGSDVDGELIGELTQAASGPNDRTSHYVSLATFDKIAAHHQMTGEQLAKEIGESARYERALGETGTLPTIILPRSSLHALADYDFHEEGGPTETEIASKNSVLYNEILADPRYGSVDEVSRAILGLDVEEDTDPGISEVLKKELRNLHESDELAFADTAEQVKEPEPKPGDTAAAIPAAVQRRRARLAEMKQTKARRPEPRRISDMTPDKMVAMIRDVYGPTDAADIIGNEKELESFNKAADEASRAAETILWDKLKEMTAEQAEAKLRRIKALKKKHIKWAAMAEPRWQAVFGLRKGKLEITRKTEVEGPPVPTPDTDFRGEPTTAFKFPEVERDIVVDNFKLNRLDVIDTLGPDAVKGIPTGTMVEEGGMRVWDIAAALEYRDPQEFIDDLKTAKNFNQYVNDRFDIRAHFEQQVELPQVKIFEAAEDAYHNEPRSNFQYEQLKYMISERFTQQKKLARRIARDLPPNAELKRQAKQAIAGMPARDLNPNLYLALEKKARRASAEALAKGDLGQADWDSLFDLKMAEKHYSEMYRAAIEAKSAFAKAQDHNRRVNRRATSKRSEGLRIKGLVEQRDALREKLGLVVRRSRSAQAKETLREFAERMNAENGIFNSLPESVLSDAPFDPETATVQQMLDGFKAIRMLDFQTRSDITANVESVGQRLAQHVLDRSPRMAKLRRRARKELKKAGREDTPENVSAEVRRLERRDAAIRLRKRGEPVTKDRIATELRGIHGAPTMSTRRRMLFKSIGSELLKMEEMAVAIDGEERNGFFHDEIIRGANEAQDTKVQLEEAHNKAFNAIVAKHLPKKKDREAFWTEKPKTIPRLGTFNSVNLMMIAAHMSADTNRKVLLEGYGWSQTDVENALNKYLTPKHGELLQDWLDYIAEGAEGTPKWRDAGFELHREVTGDLPEARSFSPVSIGGKTFEGGYAPLTPAVDPGLMNKYRSAEFQEHADSVKDVFGVGGIMASTRHGHHKQAKGAVRRLMLDFRLLTGHMRDVIHDLAFRKHVVKASGLINNPELNEALVSAVGTSGAKQLQSWLRDVARDRRGEHLSEIDAALGVFRRAATVVAMGLKATVAMLQPIGATISIDMIGSKWFAYGVKRTFGNPLDVTGVARTVFDESTMMRSRWEGGGFDRDVYDASIGIKLPAGTFGQEALTRQKLAAIRAHAFFFVKLGDMSVALPTYIGAKEKALQGHVENIQAGDAEAAQRYAEQVVRDSQGSGNIKDLAKVMRGDEFKMMFTMFHTFGSALYQRLHATGRVALRDRSGMAMTSAIALYIVIPMALEMMVRGELKHPDDFDEDKDFLRYYATKLGTYPMQAMPIVRDAARAVEYGRTSAPPGLDLFARGAMGFFQIPEVLSDAIDGEEISQTKLKNISSLAGLAFGLPERQMRITIGGLLEFLSGEADPEGPIDFFRLIVLGGAKNK